MEQRNFKILNVYFSASSSNLEDRKKLYLKIIKTIENLGSKITYNWIEDRKKLKPAQIFEKASEAIKNADIVVAEITYPSIGVGQQIGLALSLKLPVIALQQENSKQVSRFAMGTESPYLQVKEYNDDNLSTLLKEGLSSTINKQFERFNFISTKEINNYLESQSANQNISKSQYLRKIVREWISKNPLGSVHISVW